MSAKVYPLKDEQALAVDPEDSVWLSASAGTGKTQVLSARVLRLLLQPDTHPSQILCLTFTKAGAAEMATRVNDVLARWVRLKADKLAADLIAIGAPHDPEMQARARTLFASVLDCPGGGLRIDTIHAFSQWLLAAFPEEADLAPGTQPIEDRDREVLAHRVLADLLVEAERAGDEKVLDALAMLSVRMGAEGVRAWLMRCAEAREAWFGAGAWQPPMAANVRRLLGLAADADESSLGELCADSAFDCEALRLCLAANRAWGTKTGSASAEAVEAWFAADPATRVALCAALRKALFTQENKPRQLKSLEKFETSYALAAEAVLASLDAVKEREALLRLTELLTPALELGRRFALTWDAAKKREGLIDFDDQIRRAAALLTRSDLADWIRYKLDRRFDHILIDEAQDTNAAQWDIIGALTDDFFAGAGQHDHKLRTIFVVGDYKQAIFRFQGTSPENFRIARDRFAASMADAARNAAQLTRDKIDVRELVDLGLGRSYRTAQRVLDFVDAAIRRIGHAELGLDRSPDRHVGDERAGLVTLWNPIDARPDDEEEGEGPEGWVTEPERRMADRIAAQVKAWMRDGFPLVKDGHRNATPGDVMVLVRKRRELAGLIVARLYAAGVPVAGVDRLRLGAPLAVKDLMAALRFAAQPKDDLALANLLVSPLGGWSQDHLLEHGWREKGAGLWDHLRRSGDGFVEETVSRLRDLLRLADYETPQAMLHWLLVGPWGGRRELVSRLGREANDPIDELLNAAHNYAAAHPPSLQGFIRWFDAGEGELKREAEGKSDLVRVMTVHGSKGLQAPIVILADATGNPDSSPVRGLSLVDNPLDGEGARTIPLPPLKKEERAGPIAAAEAQAAREERQEHWRLLYVAMTRAEEALFVGGALGKREAEPAKDSWYARLAPLMEAEPIDDAIWGERREWGERAKSVTKSQSAEPALPTALPPWATTPIGPEPRPPRPLAPSSAGDDRAADPPLPADAAREAARRGTLIHSLLERLPDVAEGEREPRAKAWLARQAGDLAEEAREEILGSTLAVLRAAEFEAIFAPGALAEVPLAAMVGGQVIAGTADRLLVTADEVTVVDFKTARRPPRRVEDVPRSTLRQMAAYVAALRAIYPGKTIRAALLYTQTPQLIPIPEDRLSFSDTGYAAGQESFPPLVVE